MNSTLTGNWDEEFLNYEPLSKDIPLPEDDLSQFYSNYNDIDDFLTQELQDLDIPVGTVPQYVTETPHKAHKRGPSGTAIFGFSNHNKTLSISHQPPVDLVPGLGVSKDTMNDAILKQQQDLQRALEAQQQMNARLQEQLRQNQIQQQQLQLQLQQSQYMTTPSRKKNESITVTTNSNKGYQFPPPSAQSSPTKPQRQRTPMTVAPTSVETLQKFSNYFSDSSPVRAREQLASAPHSRESPLRMEPLRMESLQGDSPLRGESVRDFSPLRGACTRDFSPSRRAFEGGLGLQFQDGDGLLAPPMSISPRRPSLQGLSSPLKPYAESEPESEFTEAKTPSPVLKSQSKFEGPTMISWIPPLSESQYAHRMSPQRGSVALAPGTPAEPGFSPRKNAEKASTLPPGELDKHFSVLPDRSFVCEFDGCGKVFSRRYNVRSHIQTHLQDRPFKCDFDGCTKAFVRHHDLLRHKKTHGEFKYMCPCGKRFARQDALLIHRSRMICSGGKVIEGVVVKKSPRKRGRPRNEITVKIQNQLEKRDDGTESARDDENEEEDYMFEPDTSMLEFEAGSPVAV